jgi:uncharacterized membrane protein YkgB
MELDSLKDTWQKMHSAIDHNEVVDKVDIERMVNAESIGIMHKFRKKLKTASVVLSVSLVLLLFGAIVFIGNIVILISSLIALSGLVAFIVLANTRLKIIENMIDDKPLLETAEQKLKFFDTYYKYSKVIGSITTPFFLISSFLIALSLSDRLDLGNLPILLIMLFSVFISIYLIFLADKSSEVTRLQKLLED